MLRLLLPEEEGGAGGLQDISISRTSFSWGLSVPGNKDHVVYVWLDALVNYMTAVNAPARAPEAGAPAEGRSDRVHYWPPDVHVVGKDILYFHAVLWPALLMAMRLELPKRIVAHGW
jgi:methionyl-tRNA synthetase